MNKTFTDELDQLLEQCNAMNEVHLDFSRAFGRASDYIQYGPSPRITKCFGLLVVSEQSLVPHLHY